MHTPPTHTPLHVSLSPTLHAHYPHLGATRTLHPFISLSHPPPATSTPTTHKPCTTSGLNRRWHTQVARTHPSTLRLHAHTLAHSGRTHTLHPFMSHTAHLPYCAHTPPLHPLSCLSHPPIPLTQDTHYLFMSTTPNDPHSAHTHARTHASSCPPPPGHPCAALRCAARSRAAPHPRCPAPSPSAGPPGPWPPGLGSWRLGLPSLPRPLMAVRPRGRAGAGGLRARRSEPP